MIDYGKIAQTTETLDRMAKSVAGLSILLPYYPTPKDQGKRVMEVHYKGSAMEWEGDPNAQFDVWYASLVEVVPKILEVLGAAPKHVKAVRCAMPA